MLCLALLLTLTCGAQEGPALIQQPLSQTSGQRAEGPFQNMDNRGPEMRQRQLRALNADRQKSMVADTNKLLKLVTELNAEINSSHADTLTANQIYRLNEIEKLAHNVKEKMGTSVQPMQMITQPPSPPPFR
jgi:hypothetical protein